MIENNLCFKCSHLLVCNKKQFLCRFDEDDKKYAGINVRMLKCFDFDNADDCEVDDDQSEI